MHAIITVSGADHTGIIAAVTTALADLDANVLDVTQTLMSGYFTMVLRVSYPDKVTISDLKDKMRGVAEKLEQTIHVQSEALFTAMNEV